MTSKRDQRRGSPEKRHARYLVEQMLGALGLKYDPLRPPHLQDAPPPPRAGLTRRTWLAANLASVVSLGLMPTVIPAEARNILKGTRGVVVGERWSQAATWGGALPTSADDITINGRTIIWDTPTAVCRTLTITGSTAKLIADSTMSVGLTTKWIKVMDSGTFQIGTSAAARYTGFNATITLNGLLDDETVTFTDSIQRRSSNVQRMVNVMDGGKILIWGEDKTRIGILNSATANAAAGQPNISLSAVPTNWKAGDKIGLSNTDWWSTSGWQQTTLASDTTTTTATLANNLTTLKWQRMQYATGAGLSYTPDGFTAGNLAGHIRPHLNAATVATHVNNLISTINLRTDIDERGRAFNLSSNVKLTCPIDDDYTSFGFGCGLMVMDVDSLVQIDGFEIERGGQAGILGGYPIHLHMISYVQGTGAYIDDVDGWYIKNVGIGPSQNRGAVVHGTNGMVFENVVTYDSKGHSWLLEDGSERRNYFTNCGSILVTPHAGGTGFAGTTFATDGTGNITRTVAHGKVAGDKVKFYSTGAMPTPTTGSFTAHTTYYVIAAGLTATAMRISDTPGGAAKTWSAAGSGVITASFANQIKTHDAESSGFFFTNPDNFVNGFFSNGANNGWWNSWAGQCWGASILVTSFIPRHVQVGQLDNLHCTGNYREGIRTGFPVTSDQGAAQSNVGNLRFRPTSTETAAEDTPWMTVTAFNGWNFYKNGGSAFDGVGYRNHIGRPTYRRMSAADNGATCFHGAVDHGTSSGHVIWGRTLNNATAYPRAASSPQAGTVTYHSTLVHDNSIGGGFGTGGSMIAGVGDAWGMHGGFSQMGDYYLKSIERGLGRGPGLVYIDSVAGRRTHPAKITTDFDLKYSVAPTVVTIATDGTVTHTGHTKSNGDVIFLDTTGTLPAGIPNDIHLFVRDVVAGTSYKVALTSGGAAINTGAAGSGTHHYANRGTKWTFNQSVAIEDVVGDWGTAGNQMVFDLPIFTTGLTSSTAIVDDPLVVSTPDIFGGWGGFLSDAERDRAQAGLGSLGVYDPTFLRTMALKATRLSPSDFTTPIGDPWITDDGLYADTRFSNMRHFACRTTGNWVFKIEHPYSALPNEYYRLKCSNFFRAGSRVMLGVPKDGSVPFTTGGIWRVSGDQSGAFTSSMKPSAGLLADARAIPYTTPAAGATWLDKMLAVYNDTLALTYFDDTAGNTLWFSFIPDDVNNIVPADANADFAGENALYQTIWVIWSIA